MRRIALAALATWGLGIAAVPSASQERLAVLSEPGTPIVAVEVLLTVGPADENLTQAGLAHLAARSIAAQARRSLDSIGAVVSVNAQKDAISFSLAAAPEVWEEASRTLITSIFRESPDSIVAIRERAVITSELRGRIANPADAATRELDRAFFGAGHPWGRPTVGTPESVDRLTFAQVRTFLEDNFTPDRAYAAVVGPVEPNEAQQHLRALLGSIFPLPVEVVPFYPDTDILKRDYNSVTSWVAASYTFPETGDEEALRFVAYLMASALSFSPSQRSVYNVWSEVAPRVGGGEIRFQVVVPPEEADQWADRLQDTREEIATIPMHEDVFESNLRRYRGERIMALIAPEGRAHEAARQLVVHGRVLGVIPDLEGMSQERLREAARSLRAPTIVILGPTVN